MLPRGLLKEHAQVFSWAVRMIDACIVLVSCYVASVIWLQQMVPSWHYVMAMGVAFALTFFIFPFFALYQSVRSLSFWLTIIRLLQAVLAVFILLAGCAFLTKTGEQFSRVWFLLSAGLAFFGLFIFRCVLLGILRLMRSHGWNERRVLLIGAGLLGEKLIAMLQQKIWTGLRVETVFDDQFIGKQMTDHLHVEAVPDNLADWLMMHTHQIDEIWIALPLEMTSQVAKYMHQLRHQTISIRFALDIFTPGFSHLMMTEIGGFPFLNLNISPMIGVNRLLKALEDRILSSAILLFLSPILLVIAICIKCDSRGPVFYKQKRVGWKGEEFEMLKFRTMPVDTEKQTGPVWAKPNETRATRIGAFLRKTSLDELPQFINVLKGEMSIVGPRPERLYFVEQFKDQIPGYMQKHLVKAGITGWAQVNGWRGNTSLEKRIEYDLYYIENWSLAFDFKIIFLTIFRGFIHRNAY